MTWCSYLCPGKRPNNHIMPPLLSCPMSNRVVKHALLSPDLRVLFDGDLVVAFERGDGIVGDLGTKTVSIVYRSSCKRRT
jgi:hypothetical protein